MNELEKRLEYFRSQLSRGGKVQSLRQCTHCGRGKDGYDFLRQEIQNLMQALKDEAVSPKALESQAQHAVVVGGHNTLNSLLGILDSLERQAPAAQAQVLDLELQLKEAQNG